MLLDNLFTGGWQGFALLDSRGRLSLRGLGVHRDAQNRAPRLLFGQKFVFVNDRCHGQLVSGVSTFDSHHAALAAHGRSVLARPRIKRTLDRISGIVLIGLGARLAFEHRR